MSIDAGFGLGEALVSGLANADNYTVQDGRIVDRKVAAQAVAVRALPGGGTEETEIETDRRGVQKLADAQILRLADIGRTIEAHFGRPQDIEWALSDNTFYILQSRPITTLFPIPGAKDGRNHVYMSFGHQQMMTDAMKPLGLSFFQVGLEEAPLGRSRREVLHRPGARPGLARGPTRCACLHGQDRPAHGQCYPGPYAAEGLHAGPRAGRPAVLQHERRGLLHVAAAG